MKSRRTKALQHKAMQAGQALSEALVIFAAIVPLLLAAVYLGKLHSLRLANDHAARSAIFECTVRPEQCPGIGSGLDVIEELRRRFYSHAAAPVDSQERLGTSMTVADAQAFWRLGANTRLLASYADVGLRLEADSFDAGLGIVGASGADVLGWFDQAAGPARFGLRIREGLVKARVQTQTQGYRWFGASRLQTQAAIVVDPWLASSIDGSELQSFASRVDQGKRLPLGADIAVDAGYLATRGFLGLMELIGLEPAASGFRYHEIDVSKIAQDRRVQ
jgi:hypothetical protein